MRFPNRLFSSPNFGMIQIREGYICVLEIGPLWSQICLEKIARDYAYFLHNNKYWLVLQHILG